MPRAVLNLIVALIFGSVFVFAGLFASYSVFAGDLRQDGSLGLWLLGLLGGLIFAGTGGLVIFMGLYDIGWIRRSSKRETGENPHR